MISLAQTFDKVGVRSVRGLREYSGSTAASLREIVEAAEQTYAAAAAAASAPITDPQEALAAALRPLSDFVDGAVAAIVVGAARNHGVDIGGPEGLAAFVTGNDATRIRDEVAAVVQSRGAAEFHACAVHLEDAWRLKAGPLSLDLEGAITLMEISARAQYDAAKLSMSAFFDSVTARFSGSAGVGVDGLGKAWAGGALSGPGAMGGAVIGLDGAGAQIGVTYGRAEAAAGIGLLGQETQVGIGVSAGFELGLQLSATVSVKLGPFGVKVPNVPLAAVTWAAGALADVVSDPGKTLIGAVEDVGGAVADLVEFFGNLAEGAVDIGESVVAGLGDLLGLDGEPEVNVATKVETAPSSRGRNHHETFEGPNLRWIPIGNARFDDDTASLLAGRDAQMIAGFFDVMPKASYTLTLTSRTSASPVHVAISVRDAPGLEATGELLAERTVDSQWTEYRREELKFVTTTTGRVLVYVGLLGNRADTWCQIDTVSLETKTVNFD